MSDKVTSAAKVTLILTIIFIAACEIFYFRNIFSSNLLFGDSGDGRLTNLIAEHWFQFFSGKEAFRDLIIFFPVKNTLSYSDTLLVFGVIHSLFRLCGLDIFTAYTLTLISVHVFGAFSMLYLLRKKIKLSFPACITGVILFAYSNMLIVNAHPQLYAYFLLPFLLIFVFNYFENLHGARNKRLLYGCTSIVIFMSVLFNSYYIGYFFFLIAATFLIVFLSICVYKRAEPFKHIFVYIKTNILDFVVFICIGIVSACPFLYVYLPSLQEFGNRPWVEVFLLLPSPIDYINFDPRNLIYGKTLKNLQFPHSLGELQIGFPYITILAFFTAFIYACHNLPPKMRKLAPTPKKKTIRKEVIPVTEFSVLQYWHIILVSLGVAVLWIILTMIKFGEDFSLWAIVYGLVPGASAIRAVARFCQTLMLPVALVVAFFVDVFFARITRKGLKAASMFIVVVFAMLEYTWIGGVHAMWKQSDMQMILDDIPPPPPQCEVMYLAVGERFSPSAYFFMDTWMIANHFGLKTIGGYSGQSPRGWSLWCASEDYENAVSHWININDIKNVYSYNRDTMQWQEFAE